MTTSIAIESVKISNINLLNPPKRILGKHSKLHIEIQLDGKKETKKKTGKASFNGDRVVWNESISFSGNIINSVLNFQVIDTLSCSVGSCQKRVADLLEIRSNSGLCKLEIKSTTCQLSFNIEIQSESALLSDTVSGAEEALTRISTMEHLAKFASVVTSVHDTVVDQEDTWTSFLSKFSVFMAAMDQIAEIHPHAKMAWSILSVIPKTIIAIKGRNDSVKQLVEKLKETYDFITDAKRLPELRATQTNALSRLVQQTIECGYFIQEYSKTSIAKKIWKGMNVDNQVKSFIDVFDHLRGVMADSVSLESNIATLRVAATVTETHELMLLEQMPYESRAGFVSGKRCLPGTRENLIQEIIDWVNHDTPERMLVLSGAAGTGKSSIAHTIAERFKEQNRLGSLFCFSRSYKEMRNSLFSTISREIADGDVSWQQNLLKSIQKKTIRASTDMKTQFQELIVKPSKETSTIGPIVVVIDALDESGDSRERKPLLDILFDRLSELPGNYRFILTTRPEQDIELCCQGPAVVCKRMGDIPEEETFLDIQSHVASRLKPIAEILTGIRTDWPAILAKCAEGLFQWAETACQAMDSLYHPLSLKEAWDACTSGPSSSLYELYHNIISSQREWKYRTFINDFKLVVGAIITAREPLTIYALEKIFGDSVGDVKTTLRPFGSLLLGVYDLSTPVRPLHTSLLDFFHARNIDATNENKYYVDTSDQSLFTSGCLRLMNQTLCFNICTLETSHLRNRDVPNFYERVREAIPPHLSYACRSWGFHLQHSGERKDCIFPQLRILMEEKLLYWFEALGLLGEVEKGRVAMRIMQNWCRGTDNELADQAADAEQFGFDYGDVIEESTPHLYLSALPFTPNHSFISKQFSPFYPRLFSIEGGQQFDFVPKTLFVKKKSSSVAKSLAFSQEGKYIATGFNNGEFWFWNCESGEMLYQWEAQKSWGWNPIREIVFSPGGQSVYCCFGSGNIRIWDVKTKETMDDSHLDILEGKCRWCTVSSDGHYIIFFMTAETSLLDDRAFLLHNRTFLLYDRISRQKLKQFEGRFPVFTPKGDMLAIFNRSDDVCLWDIRRQALVHSWKAYCYEFALSDRQIVFSSDSSFQVWDIRSLTMVRKFDATIKHRAILFATDQFFLSRSRKTYTVRDISTGEAVVKSCLGSDIQALALSPDSKYVALSTDDGTIHVGPLDTPIQGKSSRSDIMARGDVFGLWMRGRHLVQLYLRRSTWECSLLISDTVSMANIFAAEVFSSRVAVSPRNDHVYVAFITTHGLSVWNDMKGEFILDESISINILKYSPLGDRLISANGSGVVNIWDVNTRILIGGPYTFPGVVLALAFSATGDNFVVAYRRRIEPEWVLLTEVRVCQSGHILNGHFKSVNSYVHSLNEICLSADGAKIIWATEAGIEISNAATGENEVNQQVTIGDMPVGRLSPDLKYIGWCPRDQNKVELWNVDNQVLLHQLLPNGHLKGVFFSDDSAHIITLYFVDERYYIDLWDVSSGKTVGQRIQICSMEADHYHSFQHLSLNGNHLILSDGFAPKIVNLNVYQLVSSFYDRNDSQFGMFPSDNRGAKRETQTLTSSMSKDENILEYALMAWDKALFSMGAEISKDGWLLGPHDELLVWIPKERRTSLWRPCMTYMGTEHFTKLKFDDFVHGTRWMECRRNL